MQRQLLVAIALLALVIVVSGCTQNQPSADEQQAGGQTTGKLTASQAEDQGIALLEQEMQNAIENINLTDLENSIPE